MYFLLIGYFGCMPHPNGSAKIVSERELCISAPDITPTTNARRSEQVICSPTSSAILTVTKATNGIIIYRQQQEAVVAIASLCYGPGRTEHSLLDYPPSPVPPYIIYGPPGENSDALAQSTSAHLDRHPKILISMH